MEKLRSLHRTEVLRGANADVTAQRERARLKRIGRLTAGLWVVFAWLSYRAIFGLAPLPHFSLPQNSGPSLIIVFLFATVIILPMLGAGRSPHILYRPDEIDVGLDDVVGCDVVREEVVRSLNLFLAHQTLHEQLGATPRRGVLFEGPPGTGKTHLAKAMAKEAEVPFLFVSSSAFQSMYYGQTNRKIRSFFRELRKAARREGGAIGFIEEIDAIGGARNGMGGSGRSEGVSGVVNELLIQMQSFDEPTTSSRLKGWFVERLNSLLPDGERHNKPRGEPANILIVAATNRADDLDPALLRPGRFDRTIHFDLPTRLERRALVDHFLKGKAHSATLDTEHARDRLASATAGYSPVMIEHLLDESLVWALRRGASELNEQDIQQAKLTEELGLRHPTAYTARERRAIAAHEAGHATIAYLCGRVGEEEPIRRLEVLSIVKRRTSLGVLGHTDDEERFTKSRSELLSLIRIAFGGMVAEEAELGEVGTGPGADLIYATQRAAEMVGAYGMAGSLVSLAAAQRPNGGDLVARVIDDDKSRQKLEAILDDAKRDATRLLQTHRHIHAALRDALLEREELVGDEILEVIEAAQVIDLRDSGEADGVEDEGQDERLLSPRVVPT